MSNTLSTYNPIFYAQEALTQLEKALGMAARVYRGFDDSATARQYGDTITIRVPGSFSAQNAPSSAQDITATSTSISLNQWKEVKFSLTDKELAYTSQRIVDEHIRPAAYALADNIDQALFGLYVDVPWYSGWTGPAAVADITAVRKIMFGNKVDLSDESMVHFAVSGTIEKELLDLAAFSQWQGAGQTGVETQLRGYLGKRYGFNFFAAQNAPSFTNGTFADLAGAIDNGAGYAAGSTTIHIDGITDGTYPVGTIIEITGHTQKYVVTSAATVATNEGDFVIYGSPNVAQGGLESAVVDDQVVTVVLTSGSGGTMTQNLAFHRNAFALAMAQLPDFMNGQGVNVFSTPVDPASGLSVRARTWADPNNSKFYVALDCLYGVKTLDGNKAVRARD
jgi:hypothetical protein